MNYILGMRINRSTLLTTVLAVLLPSWGYSITDHEHVCDSPLPSDSSTSDSQPVCLNYMNAQYLTNRTLPPLLAQSSDVCWSPDISRFISCFDLWLAVKRQTRSSTSFTSPRSTLVDILFIIEQSTLLRVDEEKQQYLDHVLDTLIDTANHSSVDVRFGAIAYSFDDSSESRIIGFQPVATIEDKHAIFSILNVERNLEYSAHSVNADILQYTSLKSNLDQVSQLVSSEPTNGFNTSLKPRYFADLYFISMLDLYLPPTDASQLSGDERTAVSIVKKDIDQLVTDIINSLALPQTNSLSLQFVFDTRNHIAARFLGDPAYSSQYEDCSHFNKAMTLKALLGGGSVQGNTLQAHLLSVGIQTRMMPWKDFKRTECVHSLVPPLSGHFPLYPSFRNNCHPASQFPNSYCSQLHGWIKKDVVDEDSKLFEGRVPISPTFSASHEDLALAGSNESISMELPEERLTIYVEPSGSTTTKIVGVPKILQWSPTRQIAGEIIGQKKPLVLRNTVVHSWPAMKKWNFTFLSEKLGLDNLDSVKCTNTYLTFDPDRRTSLKLNISIPFITRNMTREEFFDCVNFQYSETKNHSHCSDDFLGHYYFGSVPATLKEDLMPDRFLYNTEKDYKSNRQFIWISSSGMITHTHFDQDYNLFVQLVGSKRFTLWSSFHHELMYTYPRVHPMWHKSQVNYQHVDTHKFPAYEKAKAVQIELGPGDVLYVPPYTWHYVETLSPSVSLSTWSHDYNVYDHMNAIYRHDHKFDLIKSPRGEISHTVCLCIVFC